ncbi:MAG: hypothetical protein LBT16_13605 [Treponema sp.]|jgi:hypothetical protein|nr:hypothetical protein [Treponema sp.]
MIVKLTRKMLLSITAGLGIFIIVYSVFRHFTGIGFGETFEKYMYDVIVFSALALFLYNRKLAADEKKEREAKEQEQARLEAEKGEAPEEDGTGESRKAP